MDIEIEGALRDAAERLPDASDDTCARAASVARELALRQASDALQQASMALVQAAQAMDRAGAGRGSLVEAAEVARTQAHLADALASVIYAPADERVELLLSLLGAVQMGPRAGRH